MWWYSKFYIIDIETHSDRLSKEQKDTDKICPGRDLNLASSAPQADALPMSHGGYELEILDCIILLHLTCELFANSQLMVTLILNSNRQITYHYHTTNDEKIYFPILKIK